MKTFCAALGLAGLLMAGTAVAAPIPGPGQVYFSSFASTQADSSNFGLVTGATGQAGSPLGQQFSVSVPSTLTDIILRLSDATPNDGGSILVYLVPDNGSNKPSFTAPTTLTNKTLLGSILDSALPIPGVTTYTGNGGGTCTFTFANTTKNQCNTSLLVNQSILPGTYWIELVNGTDTNNGGVANANISNNALWWRNGDGVGLNSAGVYNSHVNVAGSLTSTNVVGIGTPPLGDFEMQINTPEPASMALLGGGLMGLGMFRRRAKKPVE